MLDFRSSLGMKAGHVSAPEVMLVQRALLAGNQGCHAREGLQAAASANVFVAVASDHSVSLRGGLDVGMVLQAIKRQGRQTADIVLIISGDFDEWAELHAQIEASGTERAVDIILLIPTSDGPIARSAIDQMSTEIVIRAQAHGLVCSADAPIHLEVADKADTAVWRPNAHTLLGRLLQSLEPASPNGLAALTLRVAPKSARELPDTPLFTVLTRTQGTRMETLREVFLSLSAQTFGSFEHLVIAHNASPEATDCLRQAIGDQSDWLGARIRFEEVVGGNRTRPLNAGFDMARGRYVIILDDDDIIFANWLETFRDLARIHPGSLLRATAVRQEFTWANVEGRRAARATSAMHRDYASTFNFLDHLEVSQTPPVSIAFPRYLFSRHHVRFDESLGTTEDWDYIMRGASLVGVASSEEITCIYRWWVNADSSRTEHSQTEWIDNHAVIQEKIDNRVNLLEPGSTRRYRGVAEKMQEYLRWANTLHERVLEIEAASRNGDLATAKSKIQSLSGSVQSQLNTILSTASNDVLPLVPPDNDLLPSPRLPIWQRLFNRAANESMLRERQRADLVLNSGLFDADWYLASYPDVAAEKIDPLAHFVQFGSRELRSPGAEFNARNYYASHSDLRDQRVEPLFHFVLHGRKEGRRYENHA